MNKRLISKTLCALMLISASTQAFGLTAEDIRKFFHKPTVKPFVVGAAVLAPLMLCSSALSDIKNDPANVTRPEIVGKLASSALLSLLSGKFAHDYPAAWAAGASLFGLYVAGDYTLEKATQLLNDLRPSHGIWVWYR